MKTNIGLAIPAPTDTCKDENCAWHGQLPVRGRVFSAIACSTKAHRTMVAERNFTRFIQKYERYERRNSRLIAHNPDCIKAKEGDTVILAECRPLSKTKHFVVVGIEKDEAPKPARKKKKR